MKRIAPLPFLAIVLLTASIFSCKQATGPKTNEELLIASPWYVNELQIDQNGTKFYYKRGGAGNTVNYDTHFNTFASDGTGFIYGPNAPAPLRWRFLDADKKVLSVTALFTGQTVDLIWEITEFSDTLLKYKETFTQNGVRYTNQGVRTSRM